MFFKQSPAYIVILPNELDNGVATPPAVVLTENAVRVMLEPTT
jgi:hypothetical protein